MIERKRESEMERQGGAACVLRDKRVAESATQLTLPR